MMEKFKFRFSERIRRRGGVEVNCRKAAREATLGCSPPAGRETRPLLCDKLEFTGQEDVLWLKFILLPSS